MKLGTMKRLIKNYLSELNFESIKKRANLKTKN
jgi:hypothetical protein